jgi:hypothetical protein
VDVPVLAARTSEVAAAFEAGDDEVWVETHLLAAVDTLAAPEGVRDLLAAWCKDYGVAEARLMRVARVRVLPPTPFGSLSAPAPDRPEAAAGQAVDMGDGIPTTYERQILSMSEAPAEEHVREHPRLRLVYFDPLTRRFSAEPRASVPLRPAPERIRLGARAGWAGMMERQHATLDLRFDLPIGPVRGEVLLGTVRADEAYNLAPEWVDPQLCHVAVGASWSPDGRLAPRAMGAIEVYAPAAVGLRVEGGAVLRLPDRWGLELYVASGLLAQRLGAPLPLAAGVGFSRGL